MNRIFFEESSFLFPVKGNQMVYKSEKYALLFILIVYLLFILADLVNSLNGVYTINLSVIYFAYLKPSHTSLLLQLQSIQLRINLKTQIKSSLIEVKLAS